jgi:hypothetical protein
VKTATFAAATIAGLCGAVSLCLAGEPPVCFPERTVMWAAHLLDDEGNDFGIIRAGHTVRVLETGVGKDGKLSKVELDKPSKFTAFVESRQLLAFTAKEIDFVPGFSSVVKGLPVWMEGKGTQRASITPADPHTGHKPEWSLTAECADLRGDPAAEVTRDPCHGGHVQHSTVWTGDQRVFWKKVVEILSADSKHRHALPADEWAYLFADGNDHVQAAYWDNRTNLVYRGAIKRAGIQFVPKKMERYTDHLCCEGVLSPRVEPFRFPDDRSIIRDVVRFSWAKTVGTTRLRPRPGSKTNLDLPANEPVTAAADKNGFNAIKWPSHDDTLERIDTLVLYGYTESSNVEFAVPRVREDQKPTPGN